MNEDLQYDSQLGGNQELPSSFNLLQFAAARAKEIQTMREALSKAKKSKLIFQTLPTHMRRRVMSHNVKRLPRRLREAHQKQLQKSGALLKQNKRPSRKFRRRPRNLLSDYARRQRRIKWLETHIWHAKRFHMVERWGYKLAESPCDKSFRACYRATTKHCLLQDISYITCIEICGEESLLTDKLKMICDCKTGLSIGAKAYIRGNREGQVILFNSMKKAIGHVSFIWKPYEIASSERILWIWVHASYHDEVRNTLVELFELKINGEIYLNVANNVTLKDLRYDLSRFRLTGPLSHAVLQKALKCVNLDVKDKEYSPWLHEYLKDEGKLKSFTIQMEYWKSIENLSSPLYLSPHVILSLIATDPRYNFPKKRTKAVAENVDINLKYIEEVPANISVSPIWNETVRKQVKDSKLSNAKIAELRSELLVPGTDLPQQGAAVPFLLVQRPGYCGGWDLIIPSGWAQATWITLIMWGARAGGLRETESMTFEMGKPHYLAPDTLAGQEEDKRLTELYTHRYFSLPPNKRTNYTKLAIASPFKCDWNVLLGDWKNFSEPVEGFSVLRDKEILQTIQNAVTKKGKTRCDLKIDYSSDFIVPVKLTFEKKGVANRYAIICLPNENEYQNQAAVQEPQHSDQNQMVRKEMRDSHKQLLKRLRKRRVRAKRNNKVVPIDTKVITEYKEKMRDLWLPSVKSNIRQSCSHEIIGFVTKGGFSYALAQGAAVGYIALGALSVLLSRSQKNIVLIRNTSSRQYRKATLEIVTT